MNNSFFPPQHLSAPPSSGSSMTNVSSCPGLVRGYASSHLDTLPKILNHVLYVAVVGQTCLLFTSFSSTQYLGHHQELMGGFSPVLCTCFLLAVTILVYVVNNHHHFSNHNACLTLLEPTEFTIGLAAGLVIGTLVVAILMAQTFQTSGVLCDSETHSTAAATTTVPSSSSSAANGGGGGGVGATSSTSTTIANNSAPATDHGGNGSSLYTASASSLVDPILYNACVNHRLNMSTIAFWSGLSAWLSAVMAILLTVGKNDILMARHYERIATDSNNNTIDSFEEIYRRQQREILGAQQATALQNRAAALFVGDYSSVPEVTHGHGTAATATGTSAR